MYNQKKITDLIHGKRQEIVFKVEVENGIVQKIHNAYIYHPVICFKNNESKICEITEAK